MSHDVPMTFRCGKCGAGLQATPGQLGKTLPCPKCGEDVIVPFGATSHRKATPLHAAPPPLPPSGSAVGQEEDPIAQLSQYVDHYSDSHRTKAAVRTDDQHKMALGMAGAVLLLIGVFLPCIRIPVLESLGFPYAAASSYSSIYGAGIVVFFLGGASFFLVIVKRYQGLWFTGLGSLACLVFDFINFLQLRESMMRGFRQEMMQSGLDPNANNPFFGMSGWFIRPDWGFAVLLIGAALVIAAAAIPGRPLDKATPGSSG